MEHVGTNKTENEGENRKSTVGTPVQPEGNDAADEPSPREQAPPPALLTAFLLTLSDNLFAVIEPTLHANMVRELRLMALRAKNITRHRKFPVRATLVTARLRHFAFRRCHPDTPP